MEMWLRQAVPAMTAAAMASSSPISVRELGQLEAEAFGEDD